MPEKVIQTKQCKQCQSSFDITDEDMRFYDKISPTFGAKKYQIPTPTLCPDCRFQRRASFRQERKLYKRKCDFTGKEMVSLYHPESPYTVYEFATRRGDQWDPLSYGQTFDFTKPFFEQYDELLHKVPRINLNSHASNENSPYVNYLVQSKNVYLCFGGGYNEDVMYGNYSFRMKDAAEASYTFDSEVCYEIRDCDHCHTVFFAADSYNCSDCFFIENCRNCHHCILCSGLVNKDYYWENKPLSKEEFLVKEKALKADRGKYIDEYQKKFKELSVAIPKKNLNIYQSENCVGDHIYDSKDCKQSFLVKDAEHCAYCDDTIFNVKDVYDRLAFGVGAQLCYE